MNKHYCFTDLHGCYDLWRQIKNYCDETDTLYFLGDAIDRGPDGVVLMEELLKDKRVIYLKGNHEHMAASCISEYLHGDNEFLLFWFADGGRPTWDSLSLWSDDSLINLVKKLNNLPEYINYTNTKGQKIFLSHAGMNIDKSKEEMKVIEKTELPYLWGRIHIFEDWNKTKEHENRYIIHGHSPVQWVSSVLGQTAKAEILIYANGHKIDLDLNSVNSGKVALFDLDEMKVEKYFYDRKFTL